MRNTKNAFTLVELIVVITILAILGTIAFISLQGYSQDAKNTKVIQDLNNISSKINIKTSQKDAVTYPSLKNGTTLSTNGVAWETFNSGATLVDGSNYGVGNINFAVLWEDNAKFKDNEGRDYIFAYAAWGWASMFQVAGQIRDAADNNAVIVKGSYYKVINSDVDWLISHNGSTASGVTNEQSIWTDSLY